MKLCRTSAIFLLISVFFSILFPVQAKSEILDGQNDGPGSLYALSAVLMDGISGRVLYEKDGETPRANASTTKVLTCMLALEYGSGDDYVTVSANASSQPDVQLNMNEGEQYYLEDLLYSLMLESHNDTAVAIAEHIGGSVEGFAEMLNKKAEELGCTDTHFITPNGLDAKDETGTHHTTARDLALIMRYAVKSEIFLKITETREYTFSDLSGRRSFTVHNTNAFLDMTDGVLSGKTGYTADAGYCYVCACQKDGKLFIISLLGCGWPGNKTYKWKDAMALLRYGNQNYQYRTVWIDPEIPSRTVANGISQDNGLDSRTVILKGSIPDRQTAEQKKILLNNNEKIEYKVVMKDGLSAPVKKGEEIGRLFFTLAGDPLVSYAITAEQTVEKISYRWCVEQVFHDFFH